MTNVLSELDQQKLLNKLQVFKIQGTDKHARPLLLIIAKLFPAGLVNVDAVKKYLAEEVFPVLKGRQFSVVYVHTAVNRGDNFPGISALKAIHDAIPVEVWDKLAAFYFLHPGFQSRFFLATFGRLLFSGAGGGLYGKVKYVNRLEFLWDHVRRRGMEMPEFVYDFDEEMEGRPMTTMDYGPESDHPRILHGAPIGLESTVSTYSMRCIA